MNQSTYKRDRGHSHTPENRAIAHAGTSLHLVAQGLMLLASCFLTGCATHSKAYPGPARAMSEIGVVSPGREQGFRSKFIAVLKVDGQDAMAEWKGGGAEPVYLLPGKHDFRVEFKQFTTATSIPIVDLVTVIQDANAAADNAETNIAFPVKAGVVHRIHYDNSQHQFSVSLGGPAAEPIQSATLRPTRNACPMHQRSRQDEGFVV